MEEVGEEEEGVCRRCSCQVAVVRLHEAEEAMEAAMEALVAALVAMEEVALVVSCQR